MAELNDRIGPDQGLVGGDHFNVERTTTEVPDGRSITKAWMTAKKHEDDADDSVWQKEITDTDQAEVGHITDTGSGSGEDRSATMLFRLQPDETAAVEGGVYKFDVQTKLDDGTVKTPFKGKIRAEKGVTSKSS